MAGEEVVREYLRIAVRLDQLLPGSAGTATDDPLRAGVGRGPRPAASDLVRSAGRLVDALPAALGPERADFLRGQLVACEWTARRLAGQAVPFVTEVLAVFGTRIRLGPEDTYRAAHRDLAALLPGSGPLHERLAEHRRRDEIPRRMLGTAVRAVSDALRERTLAGVGLPAGESVEYRIVKDAPWSALHQYRGGFASRVVVNGGARPRRAQLAALLAHETYPGHHTERCRKEAGVIARGLDEHRVVLTNSPQSLIAEGAARLGLRAVVGPGWGRWAADVLAEIGLGFDGDLAERLADATGVLARARQDAALLLHDRGSAPADVRAYLRRWMLVDEPGAEQVLRFLRHPLWRAYSTAHVEGLPLLRRWWERGPGPAEERYRRLLDEPLTPWVLRAELAAQTCHPGLSGDDGRYPRTGER